MGKTDETIVLKSFEYWVNSADGDGVVVMPEYVCRKVLDLLKEKVEK